MDLAINRLVLLGAALLAAAPPAWASDRTERVSVGNRGVQGDANSVAPTVSWDGRFVAFVSCSTNLVPGDRNGFCDTFVRDRRTGRTERISRGLGGGEPNENSSGEGTTISLDGRIAAFSSSASNLVPGDTNLLRDVFAYDRRTGRTERVNVSSGGAQADRGSSFPRDVSADGRFVLFGSEATNLVDGDTNGFDDLFVRDRKTGETEPVNVSSSGAQANGENFQAASISADGRYVAFGTAANNLVAGAGEFQVYIRDRWLGTTEVLDPGPGVAFAVHPALSATGRFVAFGGISLGDEDFIPDIYVHDRVTGETKLVTRGPNGERANSSSEHPALSASGRYIVFLSDASNLVPGDTNGTQDVFLCDGVTGAITRVSVDDAGTQGNASSAFLFPAISADGRTVLFASEATNLVPNDTNDASDVFARVLDGKR